MGGSIRLSQAEIDWLRLHASLPRALLHAVFVLRWERYDFSQSALKGVCQRYGIRTGRTGRFPKGNIPANLGMNLPSHPNSVRSQFRNGQEPHNTRHLGHERTDADGYVWISVAETNPYTGYGRRYVAKHRFLWEQAHGPLPESHVLKCKGDDRSNCDPSNWEAIPRSILPRLNGRYGRGYDAAPAEVRPVILAAARLEHAAREIRKRSSK